MTDYTGEMMAGYFRPEPMDVKGPINESTLSWKRILYDLIGSVYEWELPEGWQGNLFRFYLLHYGQVGVAYSDELGWIYGLPTVEKVDWQYTPVLFSVSNITLGTPVRAIRGLNGVVLHVSDGYIGYENLVTKYAEMLAGCDKSVNINLMQVNLSKAFGAENKKEAEDIKEAYGRATSGQPLILVNKKLMGPDGQSRLVNLFGDIAKDYMADRVLGSRLSILKDFLTRVGVRTVGLEKREHLLNQEIAENNDETGAAPYMVMQNLTPDLQLLRKMGCSIDIKPRYDYSGAGTNTEGGGENA